MLILTEVDLKEVVAAYLHDDEPFAFDIETMGEDRDQPLVTPVVWLSLANSKRHDVLPLGHPNGDLIYERQAPNKKGQARMAKGVAYEDLNPAYDLLISMERAFTPPPAQLDHDVAMPLLAPLFESSLLKVGHNIKFDIHGMSKYFEHGVQGPFFDTMIASWLFDTRRVKGKMIAGMGGLSLKDCVLRELGVTLVKGIGEKIEEHTFDDVARYASLDAERCYDLYVALIAKFTTAIRWLMDLEMAVLNPVLEMETSGVRIDKHVLADLKDEIIVEIRDIEAWMNKYAKREINLRSNAQKQELLFRPKSEGGLGLRSAKLTPGGEKKSDRGEEITIYDKAVDHAVLERHAGNPVIDKMLEHAAKSKLYGTYIQPYLGSESLVPGGKAKPSQLRNGRVYGEFKQNGAESGRFSSANPNLQNIPSRTKEGKRIREAFVANYNEWLVTADYSQIEPRIIASLCKDPKMLAAYLAGEDVYQTVADVMSVSRDAGKKLVLSISYGIGANKIATDIGCTVSEARDLTDYFDRSFPRINQHKKRVVAEARRTGYSETIFGRRRYLDIRHRDPDIRAMAERQAYNHLIQGSAADIMKIALVNVHASLPEGATMLMTVHDEIVVSTRFGMVDEVSEIVKAEMESSAPSRFITVPMVANVTNGLTWAECKK